MDVLQDYGSTILILACLFGFFMAWGIGANDVANAMGTSVGSRAITIKQAILIAIIFEFAGAYLAGGAVTDTIRKGISNYSALFIKNDKKVLDRVLRVFSLFTCDHPTQVKITYHTH